MSFLHQLPIVNGNPVMPPPSTGNGIKRVGLQTIIAPCSFLIRETSAGTIFILSSALTLRNMVEQLLIGELFTVTDCTEAFNLDASHLFDDLVGLGLKLDHRWRVSRDGIGSPNLSVDNAVKPPPKLFDGSNASQTVFAIADG